MIVLIDADSLVYSCCYGVEDIDGAVDKFDQHIMYIVNDIDNVYPVDIVRVFHRSVDNFRYDIDKEYKGNRKSEKPEFYHQLSDYVVKAYEAEMAIGEEVDDLVAREWKNYTDEGKEACIVSIDKDYLQLPALIYNYNIRSRGFRRVSEEEAERNFWLQMLTGDSADNVKGVPGIGIVKAKKHLQDAQYTFSYVRRVYALFKEKYADDGLKRFRETYKLLKIG